MGICIRCEKETKTSVSEGECDNKERYFICFACYIKTLLGAYGDVLVVTLDKEGGQNESEQGVKV